MVNASGNRAIHRCVHTLLSSKGAPDTGLYVGYVPGFPGAHSQADTLDELNANLTEVVTMILDDDAAPEMSAEFVGTQTVSVV